MAAVTAAGVADHLLESPTIRPCAVTAVEVADHPLLLTKLPTIRYRTDRGRRRCSRSHQLLHPWSASNLMVSP